MIGLYDPRTLAYSRWSGLSDLDARDSLNEIDAAYAKVADARERAEEARLARERPQPSRSFLQKLFNIPRDWNMH